jgi:hypothetical protein
MATPEDDQFDLARELDNIPRQREAWTAQLRQQGLTRAQAGQLAQRQADQHGWELEERAAARNPERYYGPGSPEARTGRSQLIGEAEQQIAAGRQQFEERQAQLTESYLQTRDATPAQHADAGQDAEDRGQGGPAREQEPEAGA